jgi:NTP pyrophosphatase (non-canonical NTP hydrolase)
MLEGIMMQVLTERARQERLKKEGRFKYTPNEVPLVRSYAMLAEEMGEVARGILAISGYVQEELTIDDVRTELIQVMAIAAAMVEGIETEDPDRLVLAT